MPQISKIRIVNFNFNDGNRLIIDELFDLADSENRKAMNTLINLKNGGGKSVLVQLMLQPIHPRAKTNERKIESFFTKATDHCFVVIEWFKDNSKEKLMTGIAMASGDSSNIEEGMGRPVKYYTFLSNYQDYIGKYNIITLPLSRKENGSFVAAAFEDIRKLAGKSSSQLKTYSSDSGREWKGVLADYGIIQEEWTHIVEKVNSVEGGMTKYFEGYKDSKQLLDRLLIPTIEGKFGQNTGKYEDSSLGTMLLEHSKAYLRQKDLIEERAVCDEFIASLKEINEQAGSTWNANDAFEKQLQLMTAFRIKLREEADRLETTVGELEAKLQHIQVELQHIDYEKASEEFYKARTMLEDARKECQEIESQYQESKQKLTDTSKKVLIYRCAEVYQSLLEINGRLSGIQNSIREKTEGSETAVRMNDVAFTVKSIVIESQKAAEKELSLQETKKTNMLSEKDCLESERKQADKAYELAKGQYERTKEALNIAERETNKLVDALGMESIRYFDGTYHEEDFEKERVLKKKQEEKLEKQLADNNAKIQKLKKRNEQIGEEILSVKQFRDSAEGEKRQVEEKYHAFCEAHKKARNISALYSVSDKDIFNGYLLQLIEQNRSNVETENLSLCFQENVIQEELEAAKGGYVHVSKRIIDFLNEKGAEYQTCEYYLCSLMAKSEDLEEKVITLLKKYPEVAFGVILDVQEMTRLCTEERDVYEWLPALLPVFTHEQLDNMLDGNADASSSIALYSEAYFADRASFTTELSKKMERVSKRQAELKDTLEKLSKEKDTLMLMDSYTEHSEDAFVGDINKLTARIDEFENKIKDLSTEKDENFEQINLTEELIDATRKALADVQKWLEKYAELMDRIDSEMVTAKRKDEAYVEKQSRKDELTRVTSTYEHCCEELDEIAQAMARLVTQLEEFTKALGVIGEIVNGSQVEGDWKSLFEEYNQIKESFGKELETLCAQEELLLNQRQDKKKALREFSLLETDYSAIVFSESELKAAVATEKSLKDETDTLHEALTEKKTQRARYESQLENKQEQLETFGGSPLSEELIKGDYKQRKQNAKEEYRSSEQQKKSIQNHIREVEKIEGWASSTLDNYFEIKASVIVELAENLSEQYDSIKKSLKAAKEQLDKTRNVLLDILHKHKNSAVFRVDEQLIFDRFEGFIKAKDVKGDRYYSLTEQIETVIQTTTLRASQIDTDLNDFNQSKTDLLRQCVLQGKRIYDGLRSMSKNSSISYAEGKSKRQMLRINIPDNIDAGVAEGSVSVEIEKGIQEIVSLISDGKTDSDIMKTVNRVISSATLFRRYVNQDNVSVEVFKIDINPENARYRTWEATQVNNSGGEKLVLYFAVILSLMNYSRSEYGDVQDKGLTSVLFLDNPFGPVSSEHLLRPMFNIAKHFRVQLICLSDLNKTEITSCFDLFIKAKVESLKYSNKEMLTHEGNEKIEHGFYRGEQMSFGL